MEFVDTNLFTRFFLKDNNQQYAHVDALFKKAALEKIKLVTSCIVLFEIEWILSSFYEKSKQECIVVLESILGMEFLHIPKRTVFYEAIAIYKNYNIDLEDAYYLSFSKKYRAKKFHTFDKKLQKIFKTQKNN